MPSESKTTSSSADTMTTSTQGVTEQPVSKEEKAAQQALDDAAEASAKEAQRQKDRADRLEQFNQKEYEASIEGQELPPSVQEAQKQG